MEWLFGLKSATGRSNFLFSQQLLMQYIRSYSPYCPSFGCIQINQYKFIQINCIRRNSLLNFQSRNVHSSSNAPPPFVPLCVCIVPSFLLYSPLLPSKISRIKIKCCVPLALRHAFSDISHATLNNLKEC